MIPDFIPGYKQWESPKDKQYTNAEVIQRHQGLTPQLHTEDVAHAGQALLHSTKQYHSEQGLNELEDGKPNLVKVNEGRCAVWETLLPACSSDFLISTLV